MEAWWAGGQTGVVCTAGQVIMSGIQAIAGCGLGFCGQNEVAWSSWRQKLHRENGLRSAGEGLIVETGVQDGPVKVLPR